MSVHDTSDGGQHHIITRFIIPTWGLVSRQCYTHKLQLRIRMANNEENDEVAAYLARERAALGECK